MDTDITPRTITKIRIPAIIMRNLILFALLYAALASAAPLEHNSQDGLLSTKSFATPFITTPSPSSISPNPKAIASLTARHDDDEEDGENDGGEEEYDTLTITAQRTVIVTEPMFTASITMTNLSVGLTPTRTHPHPNDPTLSSIDVAPTKAFTFPNDPKVTDHGNIDDPIVDVAPTKTFTFPKDAKVTDPIIDVAPTKTYNLPLTLTTHPLQARTLSLDDLERHTGATSPIRLADKCSWSQANIHCPQTILALILVILLFLGMIFGGGFYYWFFVFIGLIRKVRRSFGAGKEMEEKVGVAVVRSSMLMLVKERKSSLHSLRK
jgi:hypothetical protein